MVAVLELGGTSFVPDEVKCSAPSVERRACASGAAMGRYLTEVGA